MDLRWRRRWAGALAILALAAGACAPAAPPATPTPAPAPAPAVAAPARAQPSPSPSPAGASVPEGAAGAAQAAVAHAAQRLAAAPSTIVVERVEPREWPDAALGCPQPGMLYAQVITPGYLVLLAHAGTRLEYHADQRGRAVFCRELPA